MSIETYLGRDVVQSKDLVDGKLQIRKHVSDMIEPGKEMYTLWHVREMAATQFSSRYFETLTLEQYQTYFDRINNHQDLIISGDEYNHQMDASR